MQKRYQKFLRQCLKSVHSQFRDENMRDIRLSFQSKHDYRLAILKMMRDLHKGGYAISHLKDLETRHVLFLVNQWKKNGLGVATIKNKLSQLRCVARIINKPNLLPKTNDELKVAKRSYVPKASKAINQFDASRFDDKLVQYSVRLQQAFGLRREESIKFIASYADRGNSIILKGSWTKGGISREIKITNKAQRDLLNEIKANTNAGEALIPINKNYLQQRKTYDAAVHLAGYKNLHGLRHAYAQRRYHELTQELTGTAGWKAPFDNGPAQKSFNRQDRKIDTRARELLSAELGHARVQIVAIYCGR